MTTAIAAWAIKAPDGSIDVSTIRKEEWHVKAGYIKMYGRDPWNYLIDHGYRCVRVRVEEIESTAAARSERGMSCKQCTAGMWTDTDGKSKEGFMYCTVYRGWMNENGSCNQDSSTKGGAR
jgi:hypothetical protein